MCLEVLVQIGHDAPRRISRERLSALTGLVVERTRHYDRPALRLTATGGCSCDLLGENNGFAPIRWNLEATHLPKLANAVRALADESRHFVFLAIWLGEDGPKATSLRIDSDELAALIEENAVGNNVLYLVGNCG